ncbi:hypothetical protein GDO78_001007 [Eleutherodactylus coqui]|uniref:Uncharacterized protein n=1 Tax=Eleutherodactylus coqui TaxID=57060 RepID=A0A8J6FRK4_ELECQ|nr:hypothetical protein GDO78_001007 [Eleutherodactylus coqui]
MQYYAVSKVVLEQSVSVQRLDSRFVLCNMHTGTLSRYRKGFCACAYSGHISPGEEKERSTSPLLLYREHPVHQSAASLAIT